MNVGVAPTRHRPEVVLRYLMEGQAKKPGVEWQLWLAPLRQQIVADYYLLGHRLLPITEGHSTYSHIRIPTPKFLLKFTSEVPVSAFSTLINLPVFTYHNLLNSHP